MDIEIRAVAEDEFRLFCRSIEIAFGNQPTEEEVAGWRSLTELERTLAAFDRDQIVATAGAISLEVSLPGGVTVPAAGVTAVAVRPTQRRRGLLRALMERQLADVAEAGEALAVLTASESIIYGRFGYGVATSDVSLAIDRRYGEFAQPLDDPGQMAIVEASEVAESIPGIHDRARRLQPGDINRSPAWWDLAIADPDWAHPGESAQFWARHLSAAGQPDGYVSYRVRRSWPDGLPDLEIHVGDLVALDATAEAALWRFVLDLDLAGRIVAGRRPLDEPLRWRLADPRRLRTTALVDHVWARLLDIPLALGARRYGLEGEIVLDVHDAFRPGTEGRFLLRAGPDGAECVRTRAAADLSLGVAELASAYLGQPRFAILARAGRVVEHTPGTLWRADQLFSSETVPFCRTGF